jgi:hypothetical protein
MRLDCSIVGLLEDLQDVDALRKLLQGIFELFF